MSTINKKPGYRPRADFSVNLGLLASPVVKKRKKQDKFLVSLGREKIKIY